MNNKKVYRIISTILLCSILISSIILINSFNNSNKQCNMRFNNTLGGLYNTQGVWSVDADNEYICIWLDQDFIDSLEHESCHSLVHNDYEHFCQEEYKK